MASRARLNQHVAALLASTGGFAAGVTLGWNSLAGTALRTAMGWEPSDADIIISILGAGAGLAAIIAPLVLRFLLPPGFRGALACVTLPLFIIGWTIVYVADYSYELLVLGRFFCGAGTGAVTLLVPFYISEISSRNQRDTLLCYFHMMLSGGIGCSYVIAWSTMLYDEEVLPLARYSLGCALASLPALLCCAAPPSPLQRMSRKGGSDAELKEVIRRLEWEPEEQVDREFERMRALAQPLPEKLQMLRNPKFWRAFAIVSFMTICQQLSGAYILIFNLLTLIEFEGSGSLTSSELSLVCGAAQILFSMLAVALVARLRRRTLLMASLLPMGLLLILKGWFIVATEGDTSSSPFYWMAPTWTVLYFGFYSLGLGPISWSLLTDSFPMELRVLAASVIAAAGWFLCLLLNFRLVEVLMYLELPIILWIFAGFCWVAAIVARIFVRESRGQSLADVHEEFRIS